MSDPDFDVAAAQRWFAISLNNETWRWLDENLRGDAADPVMHAAHASFHHWSQAGNVLNKARAASLVANVHSCLGHGEMARLMADECMRLLNEAGDTAEDWDLAFAHDSLARAMAVAGDPQATQQREIARQAGDAIADPEDKQIFDDWFVRDM